MSALCVIEDGEAVAGLPLARVESRLTGRRLVALPFSDVCPPVRRPEAGEAADARARGSADRAATVDPASTSRCATSCRRARRPRRAEVPRPPARARGRRRRGARPGVEVADQARDQEGPARGRDHAGAHRPRGARGVLRAAPAHAPPPGRADPAQELHPRLRAAVRRRPRLRDDRPPRGPHDLRRRLPHPRRHRDLQVRRLARGVPQPAPQQPAVRGRDPARCAPPGTRRSTSGARTPTTTGWPRSSARGAPRRRACPTRTSPTRRRARAPASCTGRSRR